jgi:4-amino-4-deoxy-L-arabinose transferase-like glycosyltransferase
MAARLGNAMLAAATAALTTRVARIYVGRRAALAAGAVVALYPASVLSSAYVMPEGLYGFATLLALALGHRITPVRSMAAGLLTGVAALTRPLGLTMLPSLAAGVVAEAWRRRAWRPPLIHLALLASVSGAPMLDSSSAYNFLLGANPRARERLQLEDVSWVWETYVARAVNEADRNRRALAEGWAWVRANPASWAALLPLKMIYLWGLEGREHAWAYSNGYFGARAVPTVRIWGALLLACLPPLVMLAAIGAMRPGLVAEPGGLTIATFLVLVTLAHGLSFSETRFHLPMIPILAVLAAHGAAGQGLMTTRRWIAAALIVGVVATGWLRQLPELLGRYERLTAPDGWQTKLPF